MNRLTFAQKLWLPLLVSLAGLVVLSLFGAYQARQVRIDERREGLFNVADAAYNVLAQYDDMVKSGTLPLAAAQAQAAARIKAMRFGKDGYFALMTGDETMVLHPNPAMNGKSGDARSVRNATIRFTSFAGYASSKSADKSDSPWCHKIARNFPCFLAL